MRRMMLDDDDDTLPEPGHQPKSFLQQSIARSSASFLSATGERGVSAARTTDDALSDAYLQESADALSAALG